MGTDFNTLVNRIFRVEDRFGVEAAATAEVTDGLAIYVERMEWVDGGTIDREAIPDSRIEFLTEDRFGVEAAATAEITDTTRGEHDMGTDFDTLADQIADRFDIETSAARDGLADYIEQLDAVDGGTTDREAIADADAEFLIEAYRQGLIAQGLL